MRRLRRGFVVNCFQFVIWRSLTHPFTLQTIITLMLWIAFNLWFDDLWHTALEFLNYRIPVVNCFQFVIWRSLTHPCGCLLCQSMCCELLSICDLTIFDTPSSKLICFKPLLWIAFNLWFDDLWHTWGPSSPGLPVVVNCFQFVIWRSLTHPNTRKYIYAFSCELLSICDLTIFDTPQLKFHFQP